LLHFVFLVVPFVSTQFYPERNGDINQLTKETITSEPVNYSRFFHCFRIKNRQYFTWL